MKDITVRVTPCTYRGIYNNCTEIRVEVNTRGEKYSYIMMLDNDVFSSIWEQSFDHIKEIVKNEIQDKE